MIEDKSIVEEKIFEYIRKHTHFETNKITLQTKLFRDGIFDSMGFVLLIDFLEENFGIKTQDDDLVEENFESISAIMNFIQKKQTANIL